VIVVDTRWAGQHGIGRFSQEVVPRLGVRWSPLGAQGSPSSVDDFVNARRLMLKSDDVLYSPGYNAGPSFARQVLTVHDLIHLNVESESSAAKRLYYRFVVKPAILKSGVVLTVSEVSKTAIENWLDGHDIRVAVVGNGCSAAFVPEGPTSTDFADYFIYVGNLKPHKNFEVLLRAIAHRKQFNLLVVTPDVDEACRAADRGGVRSNVFAMSGVSDENLASLYRGSKGLLFPSSLEGFGLPALEAVSAGVRVAFWGGCLSVGEIVKSRGVPVSSLSDEGAWAAAMDDLAYGYVSALPKSDWLEPFNWDRVASKVTAELINLVSR
jgi:glycosyltransferase involved in cell wall biosynthesis